MDFGRVSSPEGIVFDLPELDPRSTSLLETNGASSRSVRIGAPAWASRDFARKIYPKGTKAGDYLARYAERFFAIELNATFHRVPDARTIATWRDAAPASFRFCPKVHRSVTDTLDAEGARRFADAMLRFGERLGPMLLQLGPSVSPERLGDVERLLDAVAGRAIAVELRHRAWFEDGRLRDDAFQALASRGAVAVVTDTAGRRDASHGSLTCPTAFVRWQGYELHPTDVARLEAWAARIAGWLERGVREVYFFVHQPDDATTPETIALLADRLEKAAGVRAVP